MTTFRYAGTQDVVVAWLTQLGLLSGMVLPEDTTTWPNGFITPYGGGGSSNIDIALIQPVVLLKCWATTPGVDSPPWNMARNLVETVRAGCFSRTGMNTFLDLSAICDQNARVLSAYVITEPRPSFADSGDYACLMVDLRLHWIVESS